MGTLRHDKRVGQEVIILEADSAGSDGSLFHADRSLPAIGVDVIDLYQLHDVSPQSPWDQVMRERGPWEVGCRSR